EASARISVSGGVGAAMGTAGADGRFSVNVTIAADSESTLSVIATDRAGNSSPASTVTVTHSSSVPAAPVVDNPNPSPTNMATHTVIGHVTEPAAGVTIRITGGATEASGETDPATGAFSIDVTLAPNVTNTLTVVSRSGTIDSAPTIVTITHDDIPPEAPDSSLITATAGRTLLGICERGSTINGNTSPTAGAVEPRATVHIQNQTSPRAYPLVSAGDNGGFTTNAQACPGDQLVIWAEDAAGNE